MDHSLNQIIEQEEQELAVILEDVKIRKKRIRKLNAAAELTKGTK